MRECDVFLLVQSTSVLTRPYCLLELCVAIGPDPYPNPNPNPNPSPLTLTLTLTLNPNPHQVRAHEEEVTARAEGGQSGTEARDALEEGVLPSSTGGAVRDVDVDGDEGELARAGKVADKAR